MGRTDGRDDDETGAMMRLPLGRAATWRPSLIDGPNEAGFLPLLFWLVEDGRPRLALRIGLHEAQGFAALCAAAALCGPGIRCRACAQAEEPGHRAAADRTTGPHGSVEMVEMPAGAALDALEAGEAGLLSIDPHLPPAVFEALVLDPWSKVALDGAIVVAGIPPGPEGQAARAFVDAVGAGRGRFDLTDAEGRVASVLLADPARLPEVRFGQAVADALLAGLARLGDGPGVRWRAASAERSLAEATAHSEAEVAARSGTGDEMQALREALQASLRANAQRYRETAALTQELMKREAAVDRHEGEAAALRKRLSDAERERNAIATSFFWRASMPARRTVDVLRAFRRPRRT